jgi:hypothetical protein
MKQAIGLLSLGMFIFGAFAPSHALADPPAEPAPVEESLVVTPGLSDQSLLTSFRLANFAVRESLAKPTAPPTLQDLAYARQVFQAFDTSLLKTVKDEPDLAGVCFGAGGLQAAYLLRGVNRKDLDPFAIQPRLKFDAGAQASKSMRDNYLQFQDELAAALRFGLVCRTLQLEKLNTRMKEMPPDELNVFRIGFADFQQGLAELVTYHAAALRDPIRPENRRTILDLLAGYIDPLAAGMNKETRKDAAANIGRILAAPSTSPDERKTLAKVQKALNRPDCGPVCAFR